MQGEGGTNARLFSANMSPLYQLTVSTSEKCRDESIFFLFPRCNCFPHLVTSISTVKGKFTLLQTGLN